MDEPCQHVHLVIEGNREKCDDCGLTFITAQAGNQLVYCEHYKANPNLLMWDWFVPIGNHTGMVLCRRCGGLLESELLRSIMQKAVLSTLVPAQRNWAKRFLRWLRRR